MHYKTQSIITISVVLVIMVAVAILVNSIDLGLTSSAIKSECNEDSDCNDSNVCTQDICLYPELTTAKCIHKIIENCNN